MIDNIDYCKLIQSAAQSVILALWKSICRYLFFNSWFIPNFFVVFYTQKFVTS